MQCLWIPALGKTAHHRKKPFVFFIERNTLTSCTQKRKTHRRTESSFLNWTKRLWTKPSTGESFSAWFAWNVGHIVHICAFVCKLPYRPQIQNQFTKTLSLIQDYRNRCTAGGGESSYTSIVTCTLKFGLFELTNWSLKSNYCLTCIW